MRDFEEHLEAQMGLFIYRGLQAWGLDEQPLQFAEFPDFPPDPPQESQAKLDSLNQNCGTSIACL